MATLTQTAYFARKAIKYGSFFLVGLIILRSLFLTIKKIIPKKPAPPPPPTIAFGKLPALKFPQKNNLPAINYKLETISGTLPKFPNQEKVFFMPKPVSNILAWEKTRTWAKDLGFSAEPQEIDKFVNRFTNNSTPKITLDVNVLSRNFTFSYDWKNNLEILSSSAVNPQQAVSLSIAFLQAAKSLAEDININSTKTVFLRNDGGNLTESVQEASNFTKVNFFRNDIDGYKVYPADPKDSNIYLIVSSIKNQYQGIIEARYFHNQISLNNFSTYPLKDINTAWLELISGKGFAANLGNNPEGNAVIRNITLGFYDSFETSDFLQPIYVFEGDRDFIAYVPAVSESLTLAQ